MQENKNYQELTREEQVELKGYVKATSLSLEEVKELKQAKGILEERKFKSGTSYVLKIYFTRSLLVTKFLNESEYLVLSNYYKVGETIALPYRLFKGINKNGRSYNQYEVFLVVKNDFVWVIRDFFNNKEHSMVLEFSKDLQNYMITRKDNVEEDELEQKENK